MKQASQILSLTQHWWGATAVARRILLELWRRKFSLVCWAVFPVSILVVNSLLLAEQAQIPVADAFAESIPPSLVGAALFFSCLGGSVATVVAEREQHTLTRLLTTPLSGLAYFLGIFLAHGAIGLGQTLLMYTVAVLAGAQLRSSLLLEWLIACLCMVAYVGVGFCIGTQLVRRTEDVNALIAAFGVPALLLSGTFVPIRFFPDVLQHIAKLNPIYHMIEVLAGVTQAKALSAIAPQLIFLVSFAIVMSIGGWLSYSQMLSLERRL